MILIDGKVVASADQLLWITQEEYDALSDDDKNNGITYMISDTDETDYKDYLHISSLIGDEDILAGYSDGTLIGMLAEIYDRLGGISFNVDTETNQFTTVYDDTIPIKAVIKSGTETYPSDTQKIEHIKKLVGSEDILATLGFTNLVDAINSLYKKLNGLSFKYDKTTDTVNVIYDANEASNIGG